MKSYFVYLSRNKLYAFITIFGFAVSLMFVILMAIYTRNQLTVVADQANADRIYRFQFDQFAYVPMPLGGDIASRYPEVESYVRTGRWDEIVQAASGEKVAANWLLADSSFFNIFSYPLLDGSPSTVLRGQNSVVISESFARKIFGTTTGLVGRNIDLPSSKNSLTVSGVMADFGRNSLFTPLDMIVNIYYLDNTWGDWDWKSHNSSNFNLYLLTKPGTDLKSKEADLFAYFKTYFWAVQNGFVEYVKFVPLGDVYFDKVSAISTRQGDFGFVMILLAAAMVILVFAVINYVNLSVAQSGFRAREMATRRLLGSKTWAIFGKFVAESVMICFISFLLAITFASVAQDLFNSILNTSIDVMDEFSALNIGIALGFIALLGVISGLSPAWVITRFRPIEVVRGAFAYRTKKVYSKILISFQYVATIALIGSALIISQQTEFMRTKDIGFNPNGIFVADASLQSEKFASTRARLLSIAGVEQVSFAKYAPSLGYNNNSFVFNDVDQSFAIFEGDSVMFNILGLEAIEHSGNESDSAFWINQTGLANLGFKNAPLNFKPDKSGFGSYGIAGVVRDFNFVGITSVVGSTMLRSSNRLWEANYALIKTSQQAVPAIKTLFSELNDGAPFNSNWLSAKVERWSDSASRQGQLIGYLALLAIIISSLGMLAMATYFIQQRACEVAVRKVFGATKGEILGQLMWSFLKLVVIGYIVALPVIWYFGTDWLSGFAYRIEIGVFVYVVAGVVAFAVASLTIFWQAYKAMTASEASILKK